MCFRNSYLESSITTDNGIQLLCRPFDSFPDSTLFHVNITGKASRLRAIDWATLLIYVKYRFLDYVTPLPSDDKQIQKAIHRKLIPFAPNSTKFISPYRFADGFADCPNHEDEKEDIDICSLNLPHCFACRSSPYRCITRTMLNDKYNDCGKYDYSDTLSSLCDRSNVYSTFCERMRARQLLMANDRYFKTTVLI